ncbi:MAG: acyltransferase [Candidatus Krumholzibacteriota bacterium]|nr:acyltransferase [Candidatus Krumholzibacteriota bacterium]
MANDSTKTVLVKQFHGEYNYRMEQVVRERRHDLDWLRVIVTINLIPFHTAWMITSVGGFSSVQRGTVAWYALHGYVNFCSPLHMYLLFLVAGTASAMAMRYRSRREYVVERVRRLLVPLLAFMILLFPVLGWHWPSDIDLTGVDFLTQFWPWCILTMFHSPVSGGPNWAHMWFVGYLFIYSMLLLYAYPRILAGTCRFCEQTTRLLTGRRGAIFLGGVPIAAIFALLSPIWPFFQNNLYTDWGYFAYNLTAFLFGLVIAGDPRWRRAIDRHLTVSLALGIALSAAKLYMEYTGNSAPAYAPGYLLYSLVAGLNTWCWTISILGFVRRFLSFSNRFLRWFNRISYPFYILHLVAISVTGHYVTRLRLGILAEFVAICAVSYAACLLVCELAKRTPPTRLLLGVKTRK